jgi:hypothetical protein
MISNYFSTSHYSSVGNLTTQNKTHFLCVSGFTWNINKNFPSTFVTGTLPSCCKSETMCCKTIHTHEFHLNVQEQCVMVAEPWDCHNICAVKTAIFLEFLLQKINTDLYTNFPLFFKPHCYEFMDTRVKILWKLCFHSVMEKSIIYRVSALEVYKNTCLCFST